MTRFDVAVIGRGLIGSAAARHLGETGVSTVVIGPTDSGDGPDRSTATGPFSSHGDEGRITRRSDRNLVWAQLASRSIARYADLEQRSGITFHSAVGLAVVTPHVDDWLDAGLVMGAAVRKLDAGSLKEATGITVTNGLPLCYERPPAGFVNPRLLVKAQTELAAAAGATVIDEPVTSLGRAGDDLVAAGPWGEVRAGQVLLATGAAFHGLASAVMGETLAMTRLARTTVRAEMAPDKPLPSLILVQPPDRRLEAIYWVPPVRFPDGRRRLKIGGRLVAARELTSDKEMTSWYQGDGDANEADALQVSLASLLPDTPVTSITTSPCVYTETRTGFPYIGHISDRVAVAVGGNGSAAKSSDEIGRLAASLFSPDGWTDSLDADLFAPVTI